MNHEWHLMFGVYPRDLSNDLPNLYFMKDNSLRVIPEKTHTLILYGQNSCRPDTRRGKSTCDSWGGAGCFLE